MSWWWCARCGPRSTADMRKEMAEYAEAMSLELERRRGMPRPGGLRSPRVRRQ